MNRIQKWILIVGACLVLLRGVFPPFIYVHSDDGMDGCLLNGNRLRAEWAAVLMLSGFLFVAFRDKKKGE